MLRLLLLFQAALGVLAIGVGLRQRNSQARALLVFAGAMTVVACSALLAGEGTILRSWLFATAALGGVGFLSVYGATLVKKSPWALVLATTAMAGLTAMAYFQDAPLAVRFGLTLIVGGSTLWFAIGGIKQVLGWGRTATGRV